ncbi:hypothetical protein G6F37_005853 [Rhizopus arrhizus]|nr:hypothetical protein G6F38_005847 [Rhizopus arrhizus]KAG1158376.1 hypothetical protein G6F37_005853 [Rhizopus arrhizus]
MLKLISEAVALGRGVAEQEDLQQIMQLFTYTFLAIYSVLLVTDGYYFLDSSFNSVPEKLELYHRSLQTVVNQLLDYFMRDFISNWWKELNVYKDTQFEKITRQKLNGVCVQVEKILMNQDKNDIVMSTLYGVANTLIIHMRECRAFEESEVSIEDYVRRNPQSPFGQLLSKKEQHQQLRGLSQTLLKRALVGSEKESDLLMSLLKELLATFLWGNILDILSDPDFLNCTIIDLLSDDETSAVVQETVAAALEGIVEETQGQTGEDKVEERYETVEEETFFSPESAQFTVMDISPSQSPEQPLNKSQLSYIIQIERPAVEENTGSEGGGYVITRSYTDFESFHTILAANHTKRTVKIQLRLPLDPTRSWLKQSKKRGDAISGDLENYLIKVVHDPELGIDPVVSAFLRKERRSEMMSEEVVSFSEEFKDRVVAAFAHLTESKSTSTSNSISPVARSRSLFSRSSSSSRTLTELNLAEDKQRSRKDSISSLTSPSPPDTHSVASGSSSIDEEPGLSVKSPETAPRSLSSMDVELLIETTYALVIEIFNLTPSNNKAWMRRSILNILREIVRRSYTEFISEQYNDLLNLYLSPDAIMLRLNQLGQQLWPEGQWAVGEKKKRSKERSDKDREESKRMARILLMNRVIPNTVRQLIGDQNCNTAMDRIWARCQDPLLNRVLMLQLLERIIKPILG